MCSSLRAPVGVLPWPVDPVFRTCQSFICVRIWLVHLLGKRTPPSVHYFLRGSCHISTGVCSFTHNNSADFFIYM